MNAAARQINQTSLFNGKLIHFRLSAASLMQIMLLIAVLVSAFSVVYSTNMYRASHSQLQYAEQHTHQMQLQWGQLLLEQASLSRQARIQHIASEKLNMLVPSSNQTVSLKL